jgi:hypothetical protein
VAETTDKRPSADELPEMGWTSFLETYPPGSTVTITDLCHIENNSRKMRGPDLQLHCNSDHCRGTRFFSIDGAPGWLGSDELRQCFLEYSCRNCRATTKTFAIIAIALEKGLSGLVVKVGEWPPFGPPTPSRLISMVGPDRELFLQGRQAENMGLGIGAYAYYRRVVERQKDRLLDEIIRVAERTGAQKATLEALTAAKKEGQFSKAVDALKDTIPPALLIDGHNPLRLLHTALSEGIHDKSDSECLELATSIRVVLAELSERVGLALKDHAELKGAVSRLLRATNPQHGAVAIDANMPGLDPRVSNSAVTESKEIASTPPISDQLRRP